MALCGDGAAKHTLTQLLAGKWPPKKTSGNRVRLGRAREAGFRRSGHEYFAVDISASFHKGVLVKYRL